MRIALFAAAAVMALSGAAHAATDSARMSEIVKVLASDEFEGRAPGSPGEAKTIEYLTTQFKALGLEPDAKKGVCAYYSKASAQKAAKAVK